MTLSELKTIVTAKVGLTDTNSLSMCATFLKARHRKLYDHSLWRDSLVMASGSISAGVGDVTLPDSIQQVLAVRVGEYTFLEPSTATQLLQLDPNIFDRTGTAVTYRELEPAATNASPAGKVALVSDAGGDNAVVTIRGIQETTGSTVRETVTLNGTSQVLSTYDYETVHVISKPTTTGTVTVKNEGGTVLNTLWPEETSRPLVRIRLHETPRAATTYLAAGKRRFIQMVNDSDSPMLDTMEEVLMDFAQGDMLEYSRQYAKAQAKFGEAVAGLQTLMMNELQQNAHMIRIIPTEHYRDESSHFGADSSFLIS
ncbi:MAG: hypothetical protein ACO395_07715 [Pontimonas sp.]